MLDLDALAEIERRLDGPEAWVPAAPAPARPAPAPREPTEAARCPYAPAAS